ncbi:MAG TPA: hypothetical protein VK765_06380 [Solirubrobacteraceae bacterium]|jgi:hypothetical protein|nr:hypothetical protein [Solirubrobacteraceae bacterium]
MSKPHNQPSRSSGEHPSDELVLAAIERAALHDPRRMPAVPVWSILEHLALARRSGGARHVSARLEAMETVGWLDRSRRHGVPTWALTDAGARRLREARRKGNGPALPESPQHRAWRLARVTAGQELERFRSGVREHLERAVRLLDAEPPPHSDAWLELAEDLQRACRRVGSAGYCLREWAEPDDDLRDVDERVDPADAMLGEAELARRRARRGGRRNIRLWDEHDAPA